MQLTPEQQSAVLTKLSSLNLKKCSLCPNSEGYTIDDSLYEIHGYNVQDRIMVGLPLICKTCGNMHCLNANILGIIKDGAISI